VIAGSDKMYLQGSGVEHLLSRSVVECCQAPSERAHIMNDEGVVVINDIKFGAQEK